MVTGDGDRGRCAKLRTMHRLTMRAMVWLLLALTALGACSPETTIDGRADDVAATDTRDPDDATTGDPTFRAQAIALDNLRVGQCIEEIDDDREFFYNLPVIHCDAVHGFEVTLNAAITEFGDEFPEEDALEGHALDRCRDAADEYLGRSIMDDNDLDFWYFAPVRLNWDAGERRLQCLVQLLTPRRGSVQG